MHRNTLGNIKANCYSFRISIINKGSHYSYLECNVLHKCCKSVLLETASLLGEWLSIISQSFSLLQLAKCRSFGQLWCTDSSVLEPSGLSHSWRELRLRYVCTLWFSQVLIFILCTLHQYSLQEPLQTCQSKAHNVHNVRTSSLYSLKPRQCLYNHALNNLWASINKHWDIL